MGMQKARTGSFHDKTKKEKCVTDRIHGPGGASCTVWFEGDTEYCLLSTSMPRMLDQAFPPEPQLGLQMKSSG